MAALASEAGQAEQTAADQTELAQLAGSAQAEAVQAGSVQPVLAGRVPEMAVLVGAWPGWA